MTIELRWIASTAASSLHAAEAHLAGSTLVDKATAEAIAAPAEGLAEELAELVIEGRDFFDQAIPLSVQHEPPQALAEVVVAKTLGADHAAAASKVAARLAALYAAFGQANPRALDELELRARPISEQWEARGPGLMATFGRLTERRLVVERADVILVHPVLGGGGRAYPPYNAACLEALLANPIAPLPEVVRLAWLLAQLNLDRAEFQANLSPRRVSQIGPLALLPPVLAAAEEVELARFDTQLLAQAIAAWDTAPVNAATLEAWWRTYRDTTPPWSVALGALEQMLKK